MKYILLSILSVFFSFGTLASNKICIGENVIVVLNENVKRLTVHDKESMEILHLTDLEGDSFGDVALSSDETKIWFQVDDKMYCHEVESGEIIKAIPGGDSFKFELSAAMDYLIHYETIEKKSLIYVYDLNSAEAIAYAKVDSYYLLGTAHFDSKNQQLHVLSEVYPSKREAHSKEPRIGLPQSAEQIELEFLYDQEEARYIVYDIQNKKTLYDEWINYSPDGNFNFEVINDELYIVSGIGTAKVLDDYSLEMTSLVCDNQVDFDVHESELAGMNGNMLYVQSFEKGTFKKHDDFDANLILLKADGIAITATYFYCIKEGVFYRFKRATPMDVDFEISLD